MAYLRNNLRTLAVSCFTACSIDQTSSWTFYNAVGLETESTSCRSQFFPLRRQFIKPWCDSSGVATELTLVQLSDLLYIIHVAWNRITQNGRKRKKKCSSLQEVYQLSPRGKRTADQLRQQLQRRMYYISNYICKLSYSRLRTTNAPQVNHKYVGNRNIYSKSFRRKH